MCVRNVELRVANDICNIYFDCEDVKSCGEIRASDPGHRPTDTYTHFRTLTHVLASTGHPPAIILASNNAT